MQEVTRVKIGYWFFLSCWQDVNLSVKQCLQLKVLMVFPSISGSLGEGTECIDVLFIFCVTLLEWMLVLRIGSKSQSRRWTFICDCGPRFACCSAKHNSCCWEGQLGRTTVPFLTWKGKGYFCWGEVQWDRGNFNVSMWVLGWLVGCTPTFPAPSPC